LQEYDDLSRTLMTSGEEVLADKADRLENLIERLSLANPTRLLKKGYSVTYSEGGSVINDASGVDTEESLKTVLHKGIIRSVVTEVEEDG
ncbi:MAG: exodeoxyribonuclease VII large subunit, partial [Candidatus Bipolaricaulota bacterium]